VSASKNPPPPKPAAAFAVHALLVALLIGLWPAPRDAYPALFHAHANALFAALGAPELRLEAGEASGVETDTLLRSLPPGAQEPEWRAWFGVVRIGYWPSVALVALLLATPLRPARRALAVLAGLALVDAWTLGRIGVVIGYAGYELAHGPGGPAQGVLHLLLRAGSESLTATIPSAAFVLVCWTLLAQPQQTLDLRAVRAWLARPLRRRAD